MLEFGQQKQISVHRCVLHAKMKIYEFYISGGDCLGIFLCPDLGAHKNGFILPCDTFY